MLLTLYMDIALQVNRQHLPHSVMRAKRIKPVLVLPQQGGRMVATSLQYCAGKGGWRKQMPCCNRLDIGIVPHSKEGRLPFGVLLQENCNKIFI